MNTTAPAATAANTSNLNAALSLAATGYPVFPCAAADKNPLTEHGFKDATKDPATVRAWWAKYPDALIGVPTGAASNLFVIDDDTAKKPDAASSAWLATLPPTRTHSTRSGGKHHLFAQPHGVTTKCVTGLRVDGTKLKSVDTRGDGGYIIWWPSHGCAGVGDTYATLAQSLVDQIAKPPAARIATPPPATWDAEKLKRMLAFVAPGSDYEEWLDDGMALHHESAGSEEGLALWDEHSRGLFTADKVVPANYEDDCRQHWVSFKNKPDREPITVASLYLKAKQNGYVDIAGKFGGPLPPGATPAPPTPVNLIVLRHISDIVAERREPEWLPGLDDILERGVIALEVGPLGSFKSFVAHHWAMRTALKGTACIILSGEGAGLGRRTEAWLKQHAPTVDLKTVPLLALERAITLNVAATMATLREAIKAAGKPYDRPALLVLDTFSKFTAGLDENDNSEVAAFLQALSAAIREEFGCTVLVVAHTGHENQDRARGAYALQANTDSGYVLMRDGMVVEVTRERFKDSPSLPPLVYDAKVIDLGRTDKNGKPVTSLALVEVSEKVATFTVPRIKTRRLGERQQRVLSALRECIEAAPDLGHADLPPGLTRGRKAIAYASALAGIRHAATPSDDPKDQTRESKRALKALSDSGHVQDHKGWLWLAA